MPHLVLVLVDGERARLGKFRFWALVLYEEGQLFIGSLVVELAVLKLVLQSVIQKALKAV
jgi:hypothetical protein